MIPFPSAQHGEFLYVGRFCGTGDVIAAGGSGTNDLKIINRKTRSVSCSTVSLSPPPPPPSVSLGSLSNDSGDGNKNVTDLYIQRAKIIALHAPHVRFSFLSISLPSSAKQQREITKCEVLWRTSALGDL